MSYEEKKAAFQNIIDTLKDTYFKFTFKVGYYGTLPEEVAETSLVSYTAVEHLNLVMSVDGKAINNISRVEVGKEVNVSYTLDEGYLLESLKFNGEDISEAKKFNVVKGDNVLVASVKEEEKPTPVATKVNEVSLSASSIKVGESATVSAKDDLGNAISNITISPVDNAQEVVEISGNSIKGLKAGTFEFVVKAEGLTDSEKQSLVVVEESTPSEEEKEVTDTLDFAKLSNGTGSKTTSFTYTVGNFEIIHTKGSNDMREGDDSIRLYGNATLSFKLNLSGNIKKIVLNLDTSGKNNQYCLPVSFDSAMNDAGDVIESANVEVGEIDTSTYTQSISIGTDEANRVIVKNGNAKQIRILSASVTYVTK